MLRVPAGPGVRTAPRHGAQRAVDAQPVQGRHPIARARPARRRRCGSSRRNESISIRLHVCRPAAGPARCASGRPTVPATAPRRVDAESRVWPATAAGADQRPLRLKRPRLSRVRWRRGCADAGVDEAMEKSVRVRRVWVLGRFGLRRPPEASHDYGTHSASAIL